MVMLASSSARTLDATYTKSQSRLAQLLVDIRRPQAAVNVLQRLMDCGGVGGAERRSFAQRLREVQRIAQRDPTPDHYKLLGLQRSCRTEDVRKNYKQLALRLHPDKAASNCRYSLRFGVLGFGV